MQEPVENIAPHILPAEDAEEGAGARVKRLFPTHRRRNFDPFVLFDEFFVAPPAGFPPHPHRGFEAITYMFAGSFRHEDNLGNRSEVAAGGAQRFTAGRGLVHSEMPAGTDLSHGIQLWINLPKRDKGIDPGYQQVDAAAFPAQDIPGGRVRVVVGPGSPLLIRTPMLYHDVVLDAGSNYQTPVAEDFNTLAYVVAGAIETDGLQVTASQAVLLERVTRFAARATADCRFVLIAGQPHHEPILQHGPYVD